MLLADHGSPTPVDPFKVAYFKHEGLKQEFPLSPEKVFTKCLKSDPSYKT